MKKIIITIFLTTAFLFGLSTECQAQKAKNTKSKTPVKKTAQTTTSIKAKKDAEMKALKEEEMKAIAKKTADSTAAFTAEKEAEAKAIEEASIKKQKEDAEKIIAKQLADSLTNVETKNKSKKESSEKNLNCCGTEKMTQVVMEMNEEGNWMEATKSETVSMPKKGTLYKRNKTIYVAKSDAQTNPKIAAKIKALKEQGYSIKAVER